MKNPIRQASDKFYKMPLCNKIILYSVIIMILMMSVTIVGYSFYNNILVKNHMKLVSQLDSQALYKLDSYINDVKEISKVPLYYNNLINALAEHENIVIGYTEPELEAFIYSTIFTKDEIFSVNFFYDNGKNFGKLRQGYISANYNPTNEEWFGEVLNDRNSFKILTLHRLPYGSEDSEKNEYFISVVRPLLSIYENRVVGAEMISIKQTLLENVCDEVKNNDQHRVMLVNENGEIIWDTQNTDIGKKAEQFQTTGPSDDGKGAEITLTHIDGEKYIIDRQKSNVTGWTIISSIPSKSITGSAQTLINITLFLSIAIFIVLLAFAIILFSRITTPLRELTEIMRNMRSNNVDAFIKIKGKNRDEIYELSCAYNHMIYRINTLINKVYTAELKSKDLQLNLLQNQINPHFLYNTLESIHMVAEINNDPEASKMAQILGQILRYSISASKRTALVSDEIKHLENYIYIQQIRMKDKFSFYIHVDSSLYNNEILKLILQPIAENAIYHGIEKKDGNGQITVKGYASGRNMIFIIRDDGIGIEEKTLEKINAKLKSGEVDSKHIGLTNVNARIKNMYGINYGVEIFSEYGNGTVVKIILPNIEGTQTDTDRKRGRF